MKKNNYHFIAACLILIIAGLFVHYRIEEIGSTSYATDIEIPLDLNDYYGEDIKPLSGYYYDNPQADEKILRVYRGNKDKRELYVFIGYWKDQNEEKRIIAPRYTSDGWSYYWIKKSVLESGSATINLKKFLNEKGLKKELVYYCYIVNGKTVSSEFELKIINMLNLLLHGKNSAALLRVSMPVEEKWPMEKAEVYEEAFIREIADLLMKHI